MRIIRRKDVEVTTLYPEIGWDLWCRMPDDSAFNRKYYVASMEEAIRLFLSEADECASKYM